MDSGSIKYIPEPPREELLPAPRPALFDRRKKIGALALAIFFALFIVYRALFAAPSNMRADTTISIPNGESLTVAANELYAEHVIRSPFAFKALVAVFGGSSGVHQGAYLFDRSQSAFSVAWRLTHSGYGLADVKITIPEGFSSRDIADLLEKQSGLINFSPADFLKVATAHEGYLFPDTYFISPGSTGQGIVDLMRANFDARIASVTPDIKAFGKPLSQVIIMASIVEREARTDKTRQTIAGILWKRLSQGMPLQVDASVVYAAKKKNGSDLAPEDFKIDSPYNTYVHTGLPPAPISNPGLDAIYDTVHPTQTAYYYYLSDKQGNMHYAATLDDQEINQAEYLGY